MARIKVTEVTSAHLATTVIVACALDGFGFLGTIIHGIPDLLDCVREEKVGKSLPNDFSEMGYNR